MKYMNFMIKHNLEGLNCFTIEKTHKFGAIMVPHNLTLMNKLIHLENFRENFETIQYGLFRMYIKWQKL